MTGSGKAAIATLLTVPTDTAAAARPAPPKNFRRAYIVKFLYKLTRGQA
jgi:hypothetical protein